MKFKVVKLGVLTNEFLKSKKMVFIKAKDFPSFKETTWVKMDGF
jgi:hypothetical protein